MPKFKGNEEEDVQRWLKVRLSLHGHWSQDRLVWNLTLPKPRSSRTCNGVAPFFVCHLLLPALARSRARAAPLSVAGDAHGRLLVIKRVRAEGSAVSVGHRSDAAFRKGRRVTGVCQGRTGKASSCFGPPANSGQAASLFAKICRMGLSLHSGEHSTESKVMVGKAVLKLHRPGSLAWTWAQAVGRSPYPCQPYTPGCAW